MGRVIGIDYGLKRCGIAVTDVLRISINPVATVSTQDLLARVVTILEEQETDVLVIGWPLHKDGNETDLCPAIQKFINRIENRYSKLEVVKIEEDFTSREASGIIYQSGKSKKFKREKQNLDQLSAVLIIKRYLESKEI